MKRQRKILLIIENDSYPFDSRVVNESKTLVAAGYKVSVVCPRFKGQKLHEVFDNVAVYRYPSPSQPKSLLGYFGEYSQSLLGMFLASFAAFSREGFNVVHVQNPPDFLFSIGVFYKLLGKKFIFDHNDLTPELYLSRFKKSKLALKFLLLLEKLSCRTADVVITTGISYRDLAMARNKIPLSKMVLVRNSPNLNRIKNLPLNPAPLSTTSGIELGFVGYLGPQDGVDLLLKSLKYLAHNLGRKDFRCVIIGDGEMLESLKQQAHQMEIDRFVTFTGRLPWEEAMQRLSGVHICLEPNPSSPFNDMTSTVKGFEYMALQKPIVAFDLKEQRTLIEGAALFAHNNDETEFAARIAQLMDDSKLRELLAATGRAKMENELNWEHYANNMLAAYDTLYKKK